MGPSNPNDLLSAITTLATGIGNQATPTINIPALGFTMPSGGDISSKYKEFLNDAANDPNLIKYYDQLLQYAKGDTDIAIQQIKNDYDTGVRHIKDILGNTLGQLGLTFTGEHKQLLDNLNQRGIALTQGPKGTTEVAGGGEAGTEMGNLGESQRLRQEAEQRSAAQNVENLGLSRTKGITQAGQALQSQALSLGQQKQQDIYNRANMQFGNYQTGQAMQAQKALYDQQSGGQSKPSGVSKTDINPQTGKAYAVNPATGVFDDNYFAQNFG